MKFTFLADISSEVPDLTGNKSYGMFKLSVKEWDLLGLIRDCLKICSHPLVYFILIYQRIGTGLGLPDILLCNSPIPSPCTPSA